MTSFEDAYRLERPALLAVSRCAQVGFLRLKGTPRTHREIIVTRCQRYNSFSDCSSLCTVVEDEFPFVANLPVSWTAPC